jgi:hypothetical protein
MIAISLMKRCTEANKVMISNAAVWKWDIPKSTALVLNRIFAYKESLQVLNHPPTLNPTTTTINTTTAP